MADLLPFLLRGAGATIQVAALASLLAMLISFVVGIVRLSPIAPLRWVSRAYVEVFRGTSVLVQVYWIFFVLPLMGVLLSPLAAGVIALGFNVGAYGSEIVRGAILAVPRGQVEAAIALNMTSGQRMRLVILPQALVTMLPPFGNLLIELTKATSLVSLITITDLTYAAQLLRANTGRTIEIFTLVLVIYFLISLAISLPFRLLERGVARRFDLRAVRIGP